MTTEERLVALERGLAAAGRRNKYLLIGLVVLAVGWAFTSTTRTVQAQADENIIRAEKFELVDSQGRVRAVLGLGISDNETGLTLFDENGMPRIVLAKLDSGMCLSMFDENGTGCAELSISDAGTGLLSLSDKNGTCRASLSVLDSGPRLRLFDENGTLRTALNETGLSLCDENGTFRAVLFVLDSMMGLGLNDENETCRARLVVSDEFGPDLYLSDENERSIWRAP